MWFFGEDDEDIVPVHEQHERARMICYLCPVQMDCLFYWYDTDESFGVWGGLTVSQRKRYLMPELRKKRPDLFETFSEVLWSTGSRLIPKMEMLFHKCGKTMPDLPVQEGLETKVLVEILTEASREDQVPIAS